MFDFELTSREPLMFVPENDNCRFENNNQPIDIPLFQLKSRFGDGNRISDTESEIPIFPIGLQ